MRLGGILAGLLAAGAPAAAAAQPPAGGVVSYPAAFFTGQQVANALEMLSRVPGFTLDKGSPVRGFEGAAGNVLIDGQRPTSKTDDLDEILRRVPAGRVERIDIIRGGAPGIDMQGKSVLANVVRKGGGGFRGLYAITNSHIYDGRDLHGMRLELSGGKDRRNWEASARYGYGADDGGDDGPLVRTGPAGELLRFSHVNSRSDGLDKVLTGAYERPLAGGTARINGRVFWQKWKITEDDDQLFPRDGTPPQTTDETDYHRETELGLRFTRRFGARTGLEALVLRQTGRHPVDQVFVSDGEATDFRLLRRTTETIGRAVLSHKLSEALSLEAGGETARNVLHSRTGLSVDGAAVALPAANVRVEEKRNEAFLKASWRPGSAWTVEGTLRYETSSISSAGDVALSKSLSFVKPRAALSWQATRSTQIRLRYERIVGQLDFDDFVAQAHFNTGTGVSAGNPNLNPEQAWVGEAALEQRLPGKVVAVLTLQRSSLKDVVDRGPVTLVSADPQTGAQTVQVFDQPTNIGTGRRDALVADLTAPFDALGWKGALLKAQGTWRWSRVTDPTTGRPRAISSLRPLEWHINFSQDLPARGMSFGWDLYSGWRETAYRFDTIDTLKLHNAWLGLWVEKRLRPALTLRVELNNLTERGLRRTLQVYSGPRSANPRLFTDDRDLFAGRNVFVRLRRTFGA